MLPLIVQVTPYFPPHPGGAERVAEMMARQLAGWGHDVRVLTSDIGATNAAVADQAGGYDLRRLRGLDVANTPFLPWLLPELLRIPRGSILHVSVAQAFLPEIADPGRKAEVGDLRRALPP